MNQWWLDRWYGCQGQFHPYSSVLNTLGKYPGWEGDWISIIGSDLSGTRQKQEASWNCSRSMAACLQAWESSKCLQSCGADYVFHVLEKEEGGYRKEKEA